MKQLKKSIKKVMVCLVILFVSLMVNTDVARASGKEASIIQSIRIINADVTQPGILKLEINVSEQLEYGISTIALTLTDINTEKGATLWASLDDNPVYSSKTTLNIPVPSTIMPGNYKICQLNLWDMAENQEVYLWDSSSSDYYQEENRVYLSLGDETAGRCYLDGTNTIINIKSPFDYRLGDVGNPELTEKIEKMPEYSTGLVMFTYSTHTAYKSLFEAIKGKEKTIVFYNKQNEIQWWFYGKDLTDTKDINLWVDLNGNYIDPFAVGQKKPMMELKFAANGVLPGKAKIRLSNSYLGTLYGESQKLYLYYDNKGTPELITDSIQLTADGEESWAEFEIMHNSTYYICGNKVKVLPKVGTTWTVQKGTYRIIKSSKTKKEAAFLKPVSSKKSVVIVPDTVTIDGVIYKVTSVASSALANNKKVTKVTVGKNVTSIGKNAFKKCTKLKTVTLKSTSLKSIGNNAFYGDKNLKTITIKSSKLTSKSVGKNAFKGTNKKLTIKVPKKKVSSYKKFFKKKGNTRITVKKG